jgi:NAD(P)-dependent dehydrogenase (short-subunit alcohol dehydrogenase family)
MMRPETQEALSRFSLEGKRGIVTGGSSGLGLAISRLLARAGADVFVVSRSGRVKTEGCGPDPQGIHHLAVDVGDGAAMADAIAEVGQGGLDFLVNNAGITLKKPAEEVTAAEFRSIHMVNVDALFNLCTLAFPFLRQSAGVGRIINISSMAAHLGFCEVVPYCSSKAAVVGLTRGLAVEWAERNVHVNSVAPGWFPSEMNRQVLDPERQRKILGRMALHRYGEPDELANMILFLVSPAASYITGADFAVDGGALAYGY